VKLALLSLTNTSETLFSVLDNLKTLLSISDFLEGTKSLGQVLVLQLLCFFYNSWVLCGILYLYKTRIKPKKLSGQILQWLGFLSSVHPQLIFYPGHTITTQTIYKCLNQDYGLQFGNGAKIFLLIIAALTEAMNLLILVYFVGFTRISIKTKNFLSQKTPSLEYVDLLFKGLITIGLLFCKERFWLQIIVGVLICLFCLVRDWVLFSELPYYNISLMKMAIMLHPIATSCALSTLFSLIFSEYLIEGIKIFLAFWVILLFFAVYLSKTSFWKLRSKILLTPMCVSNISHILHHWYLYKDLKHKGFTELTNPNTFSSEYFMFRAVLQQYGITAHHHSEIDKEKEYTAKKNLLKKILSQFPNSSIFKATIAWHYIKSEKLYLLAYNLIEEQISRADKFSMELTFQYLKAELQNRLLNVVSNLDKTDETVDIPGYLEVLESHDKLLEKIKDQVSAQCSFLKTFLSNQPSMKKLFEFSTKAIKQKAKVQAFWEEHEKKQTSEFLSSILVYATYLSLCNNNLSEASKYLNRYYIAANKYQLYVRNLDELVNENIFDEQNIRVTISGAQSTLGSVFECSAEFEKIFGYDKRMIIHKNINMIMPTFYREKHDSILVRHSGKGISNVLNKNRRVIGRDINGLLIPCWLNPAISPNFDHGFAYVALLRPRKYNNRCILVNKKGIIEGYTKNLAQELNLPETYPRDSIKVSEICKELEDLVNNWSLLTSKEPSSQINLTREFQDVKVLEFYSYSETSTDKKIAFNYRASITKETYQSDFILIVDLEPNIDYDLEERESSKRQQSLLTFPNLSLDDQKLEGTNPNVKTASCQPFSKGSLMFVKKDVAPLSNDRTLQPIRTFSHDFQDIFEDEEAGFELPVKISLNDFKHTPQSQPVINIKTMAEITKSQSKNKTMPNLAVKKLLFKTPIVIKSSQKNSSNKNSKKEYLLEKEDMIVEGLFGIQPLFTMPEPELSVTTKSSKASSKGRSQRVFNEILQNGKSDRVHRVFTWVYWLIFGFFFCALIGQSIGVYVTLVDISGWSYFLQTAYFRMYWVKLANQETRLWSGVRGGTIYIPDIVDEAVELYTTNFSFHRIKYYNHELYNGIANLTHEFQHYFFEKNIRVLDRDSNNDVVVIEMVNSFQVIEKILSKGFKNVAKEYPSTPLVDYIDSDSRFIFDNSMNDFLEKSKETMDALEVSLIDHINNMQSFILTLLSIVLSISIIFIIFALIFLRSINLSGNRFKNIFFTFEVDEAIEIQHTLDVFLSSLEERCSDEVFIREMSIKQANKKKKALLKKEFLKSSKNRLHKPSMREFHFDNIKLIMRLLPALIFISIWMVIFYKIDISRMNSLKDQQNDVYAALKGINTLTLVSVEIQQTIQDNSTTAVKDIPVIDDLRSNIKALAASEDIINSFKSGSNDPNSYQNQLLFNISCLTVYSSDYFLPQEIIVGECTDISKGRGHVGLTSVLSEFSTALTQFDNMFFSSDRSSDTLKDLYNYAINNFIRYIDVGTSLYMMLYDHTNKEFDSLIEETNSRSLVFTLIALPVLVIFGIVSYLYSIKRILEITQRMKNMLMMVPTSHIISNRNMREWVLEYSDGTYLG